MSWWCHSWSRLLVKTLEVLQSSTGVALVDDQAHNNSIASLYIPHWCVCVLGGKGIENPLSYRLTVIGILSTSNSIWLLCYSIEIMAVKWCPHHVCMCSPFDHVCLHTLYPFDDYRYLVFIEGVLYWHMYWVYASWNMFLHQTVRDRHSLCFVWWCGVGVVPAQQ